MSRPCGNDDCSVSTGIHDGLTFGRGVLDDHGYWEIPCFPCAREHEAKYPDEGGCWPFKIRKDHWRQNNPTDQIKALVGSIEGFATNLDDGFYTVKKTMEVGRTISRLCDDLNILVKLLPPSEWPK